MAARNTKSMSFSANPQLFNQVDAICAKRGCTRSWFLNKAVENFIAECLEDLEDYETAVAALEEFEKGDKKTYTLEEVRKELGL
ncbi:MAG: type II toxin-antitoxin system RelB family antitoxin [Treponema sp.]